MSARPPALPNFADPPVTEVALSAQFGALEALQVPHVGLFWGRIRDRFPNVQQQPPQPALIESFGKRQTGDSGIHIEFGDPRGVPRIWFFTTDETELIQLQRDRFTQNWRKRAQGPAYPRYEALRRSFLQRAAELERFIADERLGDLKPMQCELTYVNEIEVGHEAMDEAFTFWRDPPWADPRSRAENVAVAVRRLLVGDDGAPLGRLHIDMKPARRLSDQQEVAILTLTARGAPQGAGFDGVVGFFDLARESIVRAFASLTTAPMHKRWRRLDD